METRAREDRLGSIMVHLGQRITYVIIQDLKNNLESGRLNPDPDNVFSLAVSRVNNLNEQLCCLLASLCFKCNVPITEYVGDELEELMMYLTLRVYRFIAIEIYPQHFKANVLKNAQQAFGPHKKESNFKTVFKKNNRTEFQDYDIIALSILEYCVHYISIMFEMLANYDGLDCEKLLEDLYDLFPESKIKGTDIN